MFRRIWLMGVAVCATGPAFAQEVSPAVPAAPPAGTVPQAARPAPPPSDAKTVDTQVVTQPAPTADAPAPAPSPLEGELDADKIMAAQKAGYQIKNENGQTLLCRRDLQTGSRLRYKTSCLTAREWEQLQKDNELVLKALERRPRMSK